MYFVSGKFLALPVHCFLGFSFDAFFLALFASVIRKTGTERIDHLFLYGLKRVRAPNSGLFMGGEALVKSTAKPWTFHTERMQLNHALCDNNRHALQLRNTTCICVEL